MTDLTQTLFKLLRDGGKLVLETDLPGKRVRVTVENQKRRIERLVGFLQLDTAGFDILGAFVEGAVREIHKPDVYFTKPEREDDRTQGPAQEPKGITQEPSQDVPQRSGDSQASDPAAKGS